MSDLHSETLREVTENLDDGQYTVLSCLKEGRLYLAERAGKRLVLKTAGGEDGHSLEMLKREYELSLGLSHSDIAFVFTWEEHSPVGPCIVQEFVDGRPLRLWLTEKPSAKERRRLFMEILSVVAYLHRKGIIHNDLKPENLMITRANNSLKLIDLGFADDGVHLSQSLGGTRGYASPELLAGRNVDARSDIYSLGVLLQEMFPHRYGRIVRRCLQEKPKRRYASVEALSKALRRFGRPLWYVIAAAVLGLAIVFGQSNLQLRSELNEVLSERITLQQEDAARNLALDEAKSVVDAWYAEKIPAFREALRQAESQDDVRDSWAALVESMQEINVTLPATLPEDLRPAYRDYLFEQYNAVFPALQNEMIAKGDSL